MSKEKFKIINNNTKNGQTKCPKCGASNLYYDIEREKLICNYCLEEFDKEIIDGKNIVDNLEGDVRGTATKDIDNNASDLVTIKCDGCGAEIVINTKEDLNSQCHWCGSMLSINRQVDNGVVPDEILPFKIKKEVAYNNIVNYSSEKMSFTISKFKNNLKIENIHGVYFPYLIFDTKAHGKYSGIGERTTRTYFDDDDDTLYDVDVYKVERTFDVKIDDLTIESSLERLDKFNIKQKNSVINAIMPFDTENCIKFNANYMKGYTSEKRDIDIKNIENKIDSQVKDIVRNRVNSTLSQYNRGVKWENEEIDYVGKQWLSAYLPVWLYSCQDKKGVLHYVAVNARTGETVGSIPISRSKLLLVMGLIIILSLLAGLSFSLLLHFILELNVFISIPILAVCGFVGFIISIILFIVEDYKYSNMRWIRHSYERETKCDLKFTESNVDLKIKSLKRVRHGYKYGANNKKINGEFTPINKNTK